jgi:class 3 adenylate cyclase
MSRTSPRRWLVACFALTFLMNFVGALVTFMYFNIIEYRLYPLASGGVRITVTSFVVVFFLFILVMNVLRAWSLRFLWRESTFEPEVFEFEHVETLRIKLMNLPLRFGALSLVGWLTAGAVFSMIGAYSGPLPGIDWDFALRVFFGIAFVGAPFTAISIYFILEWYLRNRIARYFPARLLTGLPRAIRVSVLLRMIVVSLLIGTVPVSVIGYMVVNQINHVAMGEQSITSFLHQMPAVIGFLVALAVILAVGLSLSVARSVSEPLRQAVLAMERIRSGDLDVRLPVVSNDEIGVMAEGLNRMVEGLRERDFIRETFGNYLSPEVVAEILGSPEGVKLGGELREVTILVSDLKGFTALSSVVPPEVSVTIINLYLERMVTVISNHGGTIDEFTGDGILAFFGAPRHVTDSQLHAVQCAVDMQQEMPELNRELEQLWPELRARSNQNTSAVSSRNLLPLEMKIAINSGMLIVGNIGSEKRKKYGAVGSPINLTFRLEKLASGGDILISPEVYDRVARSVTVVPIPSVEVAGIDEAITLYRIVEVR